MGLLYVFLCHCVVVVFDKVRRLLLAGGDEVGEVGLVRLHGAGGVLGF